MSECKADDLDLQQVPCVVDNSQNGEGLRSLRGYSTMVFLKKGKHKRKKSRSSLRDLSKDENEKIPLAVGSVSKKGEVLGLEEVSNEFTCASSFSETYQWNKNKESRYSFRKLEDGTFAIERKSSLELNPEKSDLGTTKKSKKCQKKGHRAYKPLKICFKKRSKNVRTKSNSNDDNKPESKSSVALCDKEGGCSPHESTSKTWVNFKKMVTRRRKLHSSLKKQPHQTCQHLEASTDVTCSQCASNKNRFSKLKIPCMTFSRRKKSLESIGPAAETSEMQAAEAGTESDCERSDKALAIKYKLERSLNAENREIGIDGAQSTFSPKDESQPLTIQKNCMDEAIIHKEQNISNGVYGCHSEERQVVLQSDQLKEDSLMNSNCTELTSVPVPENTSSKSTTQSCAGDHQDQGPISSFGAYTSPDDSHTEQIMEKPDAASLGNVFLSKDRSNNLSLINDISNLSIVIPDPYEIMLMTTAASLVKKVIQSSIQQLVDEGTFLNHVPANLLSRSTF